MESNYTFAVQTCQEDGTCEVRGGGGGRERLQQQEWERQWEASLLFCLTR